MVVITQKAKRAIANSENMMRDSLWPHAEGKMWAHKKFGGFVTMPKTMPYICRIIDEMSKDHPLASTYEALWSYTWSNNAFLRFNKPDEVAYAAGFTGQRGRRTLIDRIRRLENLGFIEIQPSGNSQIGFIYLPNPHPVIFAHKASDESTLPKTAPKGLTTRISAASFNAFMSRALEIDCKDVKVLAATRAASSDKPAKDKSDASK